MRESEVSREMWWRAHWVNRLFGSWRAYEATLPACEWHHGDSGWYSRER